MIKKYDDKYINLYKIAAVEKIRVVPFERENICVFEVIFDNSKIVFSDPEWERLDNLRERLIKDWIAATSKYEK